MSLLPFLLPALMSLVAPAPSGCDEQAGGFCVVHAELRMTSMVTVSGRLPPEAIQRVVRLSTGRFRACYQAALARRPSLEGRVTIRFVIDPGGEVVLARDGGSDVGDERLVQCFARQFEQLTVQAPDVPVMVDYPFMLVRVKRGESHEAPPIELPLARWSSRPPGSLGWHPPSNSRWATSDAQAWVGPVR